MKDINYVKIIESKEYKSEKGIQPHPEWSNESFERALYKEIPVITTFHFPFNIFAYAESGNREDLDKPEKVYIRVSVDKDELEKKNIKMERAFEITGLEFFIWDYPEKRKPRPRRD